MASESVSYDWIGKVSLSDVFIKLLELHTFDPDSIDGVILATVAKRLLDAEEKIGGPYIDKDSDKLELNVLIDRFFTKLNAPLENVRAYVEKESLVKKVDIDKKINKDPTTTIEQDPIAAIVLSEIKASNNDATATMLEIWKVISTFDKNHEVTHLAKYFTNALMSKPKIPERDFTLLGVANFYAWMAYSIYDDVIDEESKSFLLPIANILQRKALSKYILVSSFDFIQQSFDEVDLANLNELHTYRFPVSNDMIEITHIPDYRKDSFIASCAIGHTLGASIILEKYVGITLKQKRIIDKGFRSYLIARQLNDDAHDWVEDLQNGHGSLVLFYLFEKIALKPGTYSVSKLIETLKKYFWKYGLDEVTNLTIRKIDEAKDSFLSTGLISKDNIFFNNILNPIAISAQKGSDVLRNQKEFLEIYKHTRIDTGIDPEVDKLRTYSTKL